MEQSNADERMAISCLVQHMEVFRKQAAKAEVARFGEACELCTYFTECDLNWLSVIEPVLSKSDVKVRMVWKED